MCVCVCVCVKNYYSDISNFSTSIFIIKMNKKKI